VRGDGDLPDGSSDGKKWVYLRNSLEAELKGELMD
jgi:hypothetical protein